MLRPSSCPPVWAIVGLVCGSSLLADAGSYAAQSTAAERQRLLAGTISIHVHSHPDNVARSVDGLEAATQARASGMRGIVLKNHYDPTAGLAYLARKAAPGLEVFGGIDLNLTVVRREAPRRCSRQRCAGNEDRNTPAMNGYPLILPLGVPSQFRIVTG